MGKKSLHFSIFYRFEFFFSIFESFSRKIPNSKNFSTKKIFFSVQNVLKRRENNFRHGQKCRKGGGVGRVCESFSGKVPISILEKKIRKISKSKDFSTKKKKIVFFCSECSKTSGKQFWSWAKMSGRGGL